MINFLTKLSPWVLITLGGVVIFFLVSVKNILSGAFSFSKFFGGFNIFATGVQGKLMYWGIIFVVTAILGYGLYRQLTRSTTEIDFNYKNNIHGNQNVSVDQRQQTEGISCYGLSLGDTCIGIGHAKTIDATITVDNSKIQRKDAAQTITTKVQNIVTPKSTVIGTTLKVVTLPVKIIWNIAKKVIK